jgi:hypothetical protein
MTFLKKIHLQLIHQTMQCEIDDSASTIQGLDNELKQTEKKRDLLLKKCCLASVQRKIQVLQSQDADKCLLMILLTQS